MEAESIKMQYFLQQLERLLLPKGYIRKATTASVRNVAGL